MSQLTANRSVHGGLVFNSVSAPGIESLPTPAVLSIPLKQHQGRSASLLVAIGDAVFKGQPLTFSDDLLRVPVHASVAGMITDISDMSVTIRTETSSNSKPELTGQQDYRTWTREQFIQHFHQAGLVGLGGACYPVAAKLRALACPARVLLVNAAECDPHIVCDDALITRYPDQVAKGIEVAMTACGAIECIVGIEDNKRISAQLLSEALLENGLMQVRVVFVPSVYPSGAEAQLLALTIGNIGASDKTPPVPPAMQGIISFNVATCYSMYQCIYQGLPLTSRITTVHDTDSNIRNLQLPLGMPLITLANALNVESEAVHAIQSGGHMMGAPVSLTGVIEKASNCISFQHASANPAPRECIRCGACADVCPEQLLPQQLYAHSRNMNESNLQQLRIDRCIECRCCDVVCPSNLPLTRIFQHSKQSLLLRRRANAEAEIAKQRFEKRELRLRHQQSRQSRKLAIKQDAVSSATAKNADSKRRLVEEAMRRAQQKTPIKKRLYQPSETTEPFKTMSTPRSLSKLPGDVPHVMQSVLVALLPGTLVFIYQTGWGGILNIVIAITAACLFETIACTLRGRSPTLALTDYSAAVTGLLIALCLPPLIAWWLPALAAAFAILLAKHSYGGLGHNIFNPAMAGYALLLVSFPRDLGLWVSAVDVFQTGFTDAANIAFNGGLVALNNWDALTGATALDQARDLLRRDTPLLQINQQVMGLFGAKYSEWSNLAYLCGGLWLLHKRIINWHIPAIFLLTMTLCACLSALIGTGDPTTSLLAASFHLFGGATMLCAFFIATDPVSAAASNRGRIIYAIGIGVLVFLIRHYGAYPDSIAFAVLLMNCAVPVIDRIDPFITMGKFR